MAAEIEKGGVFFFAVDLQQERGDSCYLFVHGFGCCGLLTELIGAILENGLLRRL